MSRATELKRELLWREQVHRRVFRDKDIPYLMSFMVAVDSRTGDTFTFEHIREPLEEGEVWLEEDGYTLRCKGWDGPANSRGGEKTWRWQRWIVDRRLSTRRRIDLKGRQIGDTWINLGVDVAKALLKPGSTSLLFRQTEKQAIDNAQRWWILYNSLPKWLLARIPSGKKTGPVVVSKPSVGDRPGRDGVSLKFSDGRFSDIVPMTSAGSSGHGSSTRDIMLDEAAHIEELLDIRAAVEPSAGEQGDIGLISTANGRHNEDTGEGNEFHRVWSHADDIGYDRIFLPFNLHPDRDDYWYETSPEVQSLPVWKQQEQFPRNADEAFALSDRIYFDGEALNYYQQHKENPKYRFNFRFDQFRQASAVKVRGNDVGRMKMFREPIAGRKYAIAADVASGHGRDFSVAYVIDLVTMEFCVEFRAKIGEAEFAQDLYWLGKWYGDALIGVETQGGHGTAVVIALRDGGTGRPPYRKLYYHRNEANRDHPTSSTPGYPMDPKNRGQLVNLLEWHVREKSIPFVTENLIYEMSEFVEQDHGPSPRARDGSRDDCVFAAAGAIELFRRYGVTVGKPKRRARNDNPQPRDNAERRQRETPRGFNEARYPKRGRG